MAFLFSFLNPAHEARAAALLAARTGLEVTRSSQVAPELREYPRSATTAINAALLPLVGGYVRDLAERLEAAGVRAPLHLMRSSGGVARAADAAALPVGLISSGPAAGVIGAARVAAAAGVARRAHDRRRRHHRGRRARDRRRAAAALPRRGRRAIRWRCRRSTSARSAPAAARSHGSTRSARSPSGRSRPAPIRGPPRTRWAATEATVTDAHVVLGTLDPARFLGGRAPLDARARAGRDGARRGRPARRRRRGRGGRGRPRLLRQHGGGAARDLGRARPRPAALRRWSRSAAPARCTRRRSPTSSASTGS